ncbi:hypothetical protein G3N95_33540 [Paraburkholderia sp. Tr-20389]|uniref:hypothetical protein n=1 Tax=Paraburkholderia sp. Tr-20389 TaxID=2703903 RepID=UPI00197F0E00|nr:hypothetical protein [Paraburkholderia sp. Tr-20389]MBN3757884.1 hypothetical protein [Paraburkholderia sp. Tr-20389]
MKNPGNVIEGAMPMPMSDAIRRIEDADCRPGHGHARRLAARYALAASGERVD